MYDCDNGMAILLSESFESSDVRITFLEYSQVHPFFTRSRAITDAVTFIDELFLRLRASPIFMRRLADRAQYLLTQGPLNTMAVLVLVF